MICFSDLMSIFNFFYYIISPFSIFFFLIDFLGEINWQFMLKGKKQALNISICEKYLGLSNTVEFLSLQLCVKFYVCSTYEQCREGTLIVSCLILECCAPLSLIPRIHLANRKGEQCDVMCQEKVDDLTALKVNSPITAKEFSVYIYQPIEYKRLYVLQVNIIHTRKNHIEQIHSHCSPYSKLPQEKETTIDNIYIGFTICLVILSELYIY